MNQIFQTDIYNQIKSAVSASTEHIYYLYLPSEELLSEFTVVYEINNTENVDTFDSKEATKIYSLRIQLNAPTTNLFSSVSIYIKNKVYALKGVNSNVGHIRLITDTTFWDDELEVFTNFLDFEIQYH